MIPILQLERAHSLQVLQNNKPTDTLNADTFDNCSSHTKFILEKFKIIVIMFKCPI